MTQQLEAAPRASTVMAGARWMTFSQAATVLTQVGSALILARLLEPSEFGLVALVSLVQLFINQVFKDLGTGSALVQRKEVSPQLLSSVFFLNVAWGSALTLIVLALADPLGWLMGDGRVVPMLRVACVSFVLASLGLVPSAMVRRRLRYGQLAALNYISFSGSLLFAIVFALAGMGAWSMVVGGVCGSVVSLGVAWSFGKWRPIRHFDRADIREISNYSLNLTGYQLAVYFTGQGDRLIIGRFVGTTALGYYSLATRLFLTPIQLFGTVFSEVLFPALSRVQNDRKTVGETVLRATALGSLVLAPLLVGLSAVAEPLVEVALGDKWRPAIPLVSILALVGLVQVVQTNNTTIFRSIGRTDMMMRWGILTAVATMTGYLVGSPWGTKGIAWGYLISAFLVAYPLHRMALRLVDLSVGSLVRAVAPYFVSSGIMAVAVLAARAVMTERGFVPLAELAVSAVVGIVVYGVLMLVVRPPAVADAMLFLQIRRRSAAVPPELPADATIEGAESHPAMELEPEDSGRER